MRCPHCAGEILDGSRFCGICGRRLAPAPAREPEPVRTPAAGSARPRPVAPAPIELPVSRGARWARVLLVLALDVALAGAGVAMILSYVRDCEGARDQAVAPSGPVTSSGERSPPETHP